MLQNVITGAAGSGMQILPPGAAGSGFINSSAGPILVVLGVLVLLAVGPVRDNITSLWKQLVSYFMGPSPDDTAEEQQDDADTTSSNARASEADTYDFDLKVLALGDTATTDSDTP